MTDESYRALPHWANSDLSALAAHVFGRKPIRASAETLAFGTAFHSLVLEADCTNHSDIGLSDWPKLWDMCESVKNDKDLTALIARSQIEQVRIWQDPVTGLWCKGKLDVVPSVKHIIDLKTTSCRSKSDFLTTCHDYDYDRQAAHYLSSDDNARFFEFVGVQKQPPYNVYRLPFHRSDEFIRNGFVKRDKLLKLAAEQVRSGGWVPGSWKVNETAK